MPRLINPSPEVATPAIAGMGEPVLALPAPAVESRVKFATQVKLTSDQEDKFARDSLFRITELRREMGLSEQNEVLPGSWMWIRRCHEQYYEGDLTWRLAFGGIFQKSNITLGSGLRHTRYISARVQDDLLGTSPFMAALATKPSKEALAKQVEDYIQTKIEQSNVRKSLREAQKIALYRNECVVKTGFMSDITPFIGEATVLCDVQTGQPITTPEKGLYVFENDDVIPHPSVEGLMMLETDPSFLMADYSVPGFVLIPAAGDQPARLGAYQTITDLPQKAVRKEGVFADPLDYRSFLCPLKVKDIHEADTVVHLRLETPLRLQKIYGGIDVSQNYFSFWDNPGQDKPKYEQGEGGNPTTSIYQQVIVAEVYRRCDPDETGEEKEIFAVFDFSNQKLIYYNYLDNHMKKRPFDVVPGIEKVAGRWYGRGIYGMLESHLFYEDVEASRSFFKNSKDATIQFAYKDACEDWQNGLEPIVGSDDTFWLRKDWNADGRQIKPIWRENLSENINPDIELMNTFRQSSDSLIGAISSQSANQSDFNQSKTATGNQLVQQASDVITKATEQDQTEAINDVLAQVVDFILEHMDATVLAADPTTQLLSTVNRNEARGLSRDVRLLLTRSRSTMLLNTSSQLIDIGERYWQLRAQDPRIAKSLRSAFVSQAKALECNDTDTMFPDITDEDIQQWQQAQQQQQAPPAKPLSENVSIKLGDLVGSERAQALSKVGIQQDDAALAAAQQQEAAQAQADAVAAQSRLRAMPSPN